MSMSMSMLIERGEDERADRDGAGPEWWTMLIAGTTRSSCGRLGPMARRGRAKIKHTHTYFSRGLEGSRAAHHRAWAFILRVIWGTDIKNMKIEYAFLRPESDRVAARPRALLHALVVRRTLGDPNVQLRMVQSVAGSACFVKRRARRAIDLNLKVGGDVDGNVHVHKQRPVEPEVDHRCRSKHLPRKNMPTDTRIGLRQQLSR